MIGIYLFVAIFYIIRTGTEVMLNKIKPENKLLERCEKYRLLTEKALKKAKVIIPVESAMYPIAKDFIEMAKNYLSDGKYYESKKEYEIALASYAYAHAWLDASARIGFIDVKRDHKLFTLYK